MKSKLLLAFMITTLSLIISSCGSRKGKKEQMPYLTMDKIEYVGYRWGGDPVDWQQEKFIFDRINHYFECYRYPYWNGKDYEFIWYLVGTGTYRESPELNHKINIEFDSKDNYRSSGLWKYGIISWDRMELEGYPDGAILVCDPVE